MSAEWLLIALPIVFSLGWFAARLDIRHIRKSAGEIPQSYLRGLSQLLAGDDDRALDSFLSAAEHDSVELQFAIGALSRKQGNHERALQVHRALYRREDLPATTRNQALWALCEDYFNMGLVDYAQQHASLLFTDPAYQQQVINRLLTIYQRRHDYAAALQLLQTLDEDARLGRRVMVAQFYCQIADLETTNSVARQQHYETALQTNPDCVRARLALAKLHPNAAADHYQQIQRIAPRYLFLAADALLANLAYSGDANAGKQPSSIAETEATLLRWLQAYPTAILFKKVFDAAPAQRAAICTSYLTTHQSPTAATYWLTQTAPAAGAHTQAWQAIKTLIARQTTKDFICNHCGYQVNDFSWQCTGCLEWESLKPQ